MIKILITGKNSYVGIQFEKFIHQFGDNYSVKTISVRGNKWEQFSFNKYDVVIHVAGIAHVSAKKNQEKSYYVINRDLAIKVAKKAKVSGVSQFIFMSSIIVYGENTIKNRNIIINKDDLPCPSGFYGNSKLEAEKGIIRLQDSSFHIVVLRSPMIYGRESKGNFSKLVKLARVLPIFPNIKNKRSMIYIGNLCLFIKAVIDNKCEGIFHPQNNEYVNTSDLFFLVAKYNGNAIIRTNIFNFFIRILQRVNNTSNKVFGTFIYEKEIDEKFYITDNFSDFEASIKESCEK